MMTKTQIQTLAPSIFTTQPDPKMSNRYVFVPTYEIMEKFESENWNLSSVKQNGKGIYSTHELRFRNGELPQVGDSLFEAVVKNSHNGLATFSVTAGLHRLVCSNGLTVPTSVVESFNIRHKSFEYGDVKRLTNNFAEKLTTIEKSVNKMMDRELTEEEKVKFVLKASTLRWKTGSIPSSLNIDDVLNPVRDEDKGNSLWKVFNVVQEKFVRGGLNYTTEKGRRTGLRKLNDVIAVNQINTKLWEMAEEIY